MVDYCFLRFHFICLKAHTEYAFSYICITNRRRLKDPRLGLWKTGAGISTRRLLGVWGWAGVFLFSNTDGLGRVWSESLRCYYRWWKTGGKFRKWCKNQKRQKFKLLDLAYVMVLLNCSTDYNWSSYVCSILTPPRNYFQYFVRSTWETQNTQPGWNVQLINSTQSL